MKKILIAFIIAAVFIGSCNKSTTGDNKDSTGIITGRDDNKCYCCWGYFIEIDSVTYMFDKIPSNSAFDPTTVTYPTTVKVKWRPSQERHCSQFIDVLDISR